MAQIVLDTSQSGNPRLRISKNGEKKFLRLPPIKGQRKFTKNQLEFLLTNIAQIGRTTEVQNLFQAEFKKPVSKVYVSYLENKSKYVEVIKKIREDFSRNLMTSSYLANKRIRVEKYTDIYEKAMDLKDYKLANNVLINIREEVEPKSDKFNFTLNQSNEYYTLTLEEIRRKKAEVLERLERKKITSELSSSDSPVTIEDEEK